MVFTHFDSFCHIQANKVETGLPCWLSGKEPACKAGAAGSVPDQEDPLEEGTATPSSILVWRIPWTEEPHGLLSIGLQKVGYN